MDAGVHFIYRALHDPLLIVCKCRSSYSVEYPGKRDGQFGPKNLQQFGMFQAKDKFQYPVYCIDWVDLTGLSYSMVQYLFPSVTSDSHTASAVRT